ncbi:hypothetical protein DRQ29_05065 [bacterium]|nr:hypothetical protein [bacterium]RKZ26304.1 MAG: hypothetical protein DRQ29_05065 [bacterium]
MRYKKLIFAFLLLAGIISIIGCGDKSGESYINLPEGPKILFRGGIGKITIRYVPPPDPIFRISNAMEYVEFPYIKDNYGIPDKPLIIDYTVENSVIAPVVIQRTSIPQFNDYILRILQSWTYTRFGKGPMRISVDVAKKRISVDVSNIRLAEQEPGRPMPKMGNMRELVKQMGFTVVTGNLY